MSDVENKMSLAERELGRSVVYINPNISEEARNKNKNPLYFGIKDTNQISESLIEKLRSNKNFVWLTVDKASNRGRAIDTDLINPVTYRVMTGSTSGGPVNILKGIIDFAIGTDGGGSILGPALSCQLPSMIGAGLGVFVRHKKKSTDNMEYTGSIGVVGKNIQILKTVMECLTEENLTRTTTGKRLKVVVPKKGTIFCPNGEDMHEKVMFYLSKIDSGGYMIKNVDMTGIEDRKTAMKVIKESFETHGADIIVTCEGPADVYGYGETIPQFFGKQGMDLTRNHGKYLVRAANMCRATAITVPIEILASGLVIIAGKGIIPSTYAIEMAGKLEKVISMPEVWKRYFIQESHFSGLRLK